MLWSRLVDLQQPQPSVDVTLIDSHLSNYQTLVSSCIDSVVKVTHTWVSVCYCLVQRTNNETDQNDKGTARTLYSAGKTMHRPRRKHASRERALKIQHVLFRYIPSMSVLVILGRKCKLTASHTANCSFVSPVGCAPQALLRLDKDRGQRDGQTDARPLHYAYR